LHSTHKGKIVLYTAIAQNNLTDSYQAGLTLGRAITAQITTRVDVIILFASPSHRNPALLQGIKELCPSSIIVGSESTAVDSAEAATRCSAIAFSADHLDISFTAAVVRNLSTQFDRAIWSLNAALQTSPVSCYPYHTSLIFANAQTTHLTSLVNQLVFLTGGAFDLLGTGTQQNSEQALRQPVYFDTQILTDAVAILIINSRRPLGLGICHGWQMNNQPVQVTRTSGRHILELNHLPAVEALHQHLSQNERVLVRNSPHLLAVAVKGAASHQSTYVNIPITIQDNGSLFCRADVPQGTMVSLLSAITSPAETARIAMQNAKKRLLSSRPAAAFLFTGSSISNENGNEEVNTQAVMQQLPEGVPLLTCTTDGQLIHSHGQASGYYNGTAVVGIFPDAS
jgi:hypothetical protein